MNELERLLYQWRKIWSNTSFFEQIDSKDELLSIYLKYIPKNGLILEGGAGYGRLVFILSQLGYKIVGVELVKECVETVKKIYPEIDLRQGDVNKLDFPESYFDTYISIGVIEHFIEGPYQALKEMFRVLKKGGVAIVFVPAYNYLRQIKYTLRDSIGRLIKENSFFRWLFGRKKIVYNIMKSKQVFFQQKKLAKQEVAKGKYASFGIDPEKGVLFFEYRYKRNVLERELTENGFQILNSFPVCYESGLIEDLGQFVTQNFSLKEGLKSSLNLFGKFLNIIFKKISAHFHNHGYLVIAQK